MLTVLECCKQSRCPSKVCLQVLAEAGPDGLALTEVVRRIQADMERQFKTMYQPAAHAFRR